MFTEVFFIHCPPPRTFTAFPLVVDVGGDQGGGGGVPADPHVLR